MKTPEQRHSEALLPKFKALAEEVLKESGASGVRIEGTYVLHQAAGLKGRGRLELRVFVTSDGSQERKGSGPLQPRGTSLQCDAEEVLKRKVLRRKR